MSIRTTTSLVALAALALAGCGGGGTGASDGGGTTVTIATKEFAFDPASVTAPAGGFTLTVDNAKGLVEHDVTIEGEDITVLAQPGASASAEVDLEAGTYTIFCSVPGHRQSGMEGELVIE